MHPSINRATLSSGLTTLRASTGHIFQVRNHVKVYPWRVNKSNPFSYQDTSKTSYTDRHNINEFYHNKKTRKEWMYVIPKDKDNRFNAFKWNESYKSDPKEAKATSASRMQSLTDSLIARGPARESDPYDPPEGVREKVLNIYRTIHVALGQSSLADASTQVADSSQDEASLSINLNEHKALKFNLLTKCIEAFEHELPSSFLNDIETIRDLVEYFSTPVRGVDPYSALLRKEDSLPANLCLIAEPIRYDRENDDFFGGYTALPGLVSKVPGLRASKKYPVLNQDEFQWPDI